MTSAFRWTSWGAPPRFGAATVAVTLAVFIVGTIASLIASGAFG